METNLTNGAPVIINDKHYGRIVYRTADGFYGVILGDDLRTCYAAFADGIIELTTVIPELNPEAEWSAITFAALAA